MLISILLWLVMLPGSFEPENPPVQIDELLAPVALPAGYSGLTYADKDEKEKILARRAVISKPNVIPKVVIQIELADRSKTAERRTAAKGYINGLAQGMADGGFKAIEKNIPDIDKNNFEKPLSVSLIFAGPENKKMYINQEIFFTDRGFLIQVISDDPKELAVLTQWAKSIKPKAK